MIDQLLAQAFILLHGGIFLFIEIVGGVCSEREGDVAQKFVNVVGAVLCPPFKQMGLEVHADFV